MKFEEYTEQALKTESDMEGVQLRIADQRSVRRVHAALGLVSEVQELRDGFAFSNTMVVLPQDQDLNVREELGDLCWFLSVAYSAEDIREQHDDIVLIPVTTWVGIDNILDEMMSAAATYADAVKASVFYGKPNHEARINALCDLEGWLIKFWNQYSGNHGRKPVGLEEIRAANIRKLRARYGDKFTEERALERDKKAEYAAIGEEAQ